MAPLYANQTSYSPLLQGESDPGLLDDFERGSRLPKSDLYSSGVLRLKDGMRLLEPEEAPIEYIVEEGDTLFDLCDQLIDDKAYWPKLWSLNPYIKNPHVIYPAMRIRFYPGSLDAPPYLTLEELTGPMLEVRAKKIADSLIDNLDLNDEEATRVSVKFVEPKEVDTTNYISEVGRIFSPNSLTLTLPGFASKVPLKSYCSIELSIDKETLITSDQPFVCRLDSRLSSRLALQNVYTVVRPETFSRFQSVRPSVHVYRFIGDVRLEKFLNRKNRAIFSVLSMRDTIGPQDLILPQYDYYNRKLSLASSSVTSNRFDISVVALEHDGQELGGQHQLVFLSHGLEANLHANDTFGIYRTIDIEGKGKRLPLSQQVGLLRIVDSSSGGSVGYVLSSTRSIEINDRLGYEEKLDNFP